MPRSKHIYIYNFIYIYICLGPSKILCYLTPPPRSFKSAMNCLRKETFGDLDEVARLHNPNAWINMHRKAAASPHAQSYNQVLVCFGVVTISKRENHTQTRFEVQVKTKTNWFFQQSLSPSIHALWLSIPRWRSASLRWWEPPEGQQEVVGGITRSRN